MRNAQWSIGANLFFCGVNVLVVLVVCENYVSDVCGYVLFCDIFWILF